MQNSTSSQKKKAVGTRRSKLATRQFFFGTTDVTGTIADVGEAGMIQPGDHAQVSFTLQRPVGMPVGAGVILTVD